MPIPLSVSSYFDPIIEELKKIIEDIGPGNVTAVNLNYSQTDTTQSASGSVSTANKTYTVSGWQPRPPASFNPPSATSPKHGGAGTVEFTCDPALAWTATASDDWLTTADTSGTGPKTITYNVAANPGEARTGYLTIASRSFTVTQDSGL